MAIPPLHIGVYDKDFGFVRPVGAPKFCTVIPRYNAVGMATVGLLASDRAVPHLLEPGARLWIRDENREHLMSGYVADFRGRGPARRSLIEFDIQDDFALFTEVLGWVIPTAAIDQQGTAGTNWTLTAAAETVVKTATQLNAVDRLGLPLTIEPTQGRGSTVTAKLRNQPLYDRLFLTEDGGADIRNAGLGYGVRQKPTGGLELYTYEPRTYPRTLTEESGVVTDWSYVKRSAKVTRAVVGGQGEAQARVWRAYVDTALEAASGRKIERYRDARDVSDVSILPQRWEQTRLEGAPSASVALTLSQTKHFRYSTSGSGVRVGDTVTVGIGGQTFTERMDEATLSWTQGDGWKATPKFGERADSTDTLLAKTVASIARRLSNQNRT